MQVCAWGCEAGKLPAGAAGYPQGQQAVPGGSGAGNQVAGQRRPARQVRPEARRLQVRRTPCPLLNPSLAVRAHNVKQLLAGKEGHVKFS